MADADDFASLLSEAKVGSPVLPQSIGMPLYCSMAQLLGLMVLFRSVPTAVMSMAETGIALKNPKDPRWLLGDGDELARVQGGQTEWAISYKLSDNGGRDLFLIAQFGLEGYRNAMLAETAAGFAAKYDHKVVSAVRKLATLKDKENPWWRVLQDLRSDYEAMSPRRMGLGLNINADNDNDDPIVQRMAELEKPDNQTVLTVIEVALTTRVWDREAVIFLLETDPYRHLEAAASRIPPAETKLPILSFARMPSTWRFLVPLQASEVVLNKDWRPGTIAHTREVFVAPRV